MGTAFAHCVPNSVLKITNGGRRGRQLSSKRNKMTFSDLPKKALKLILGHISQSELQHFRLVSRSWNTFIVEEFPVELYITQQNYEQLFKCRNAISAEIHSLTLEYNGHVSFGKSVRSVTFSGKVLTSNLFSILKFCPDVETLHFHSLKNVLGIEGNESVKLPNLNTIEIVVRPDQETFTADEIIIISVLCRMIFGSLKTIKVTPKMPFEYLDEDFDDDEYMDMDETVAVSSEDTQSFSMSSGSMDLDFSNGQILMTTRRSVSEGADNLEPAPLEEVQEVNEEESSNVENPSEAVHPPPPGPPQTAGTQTQTPTQTRNSNMRIIVNRAANFANPTGSNADTIASTSSTRPPRHNISDIEERIIAANFELLMEMNAETTALNILNDSQSRTRIESAMFYDMPGVTMPTMKNTQFFELCKGNYPTLKNLLVTTRSDFTCFGNLTSFMRDLSKVQFDEMEYSFGRMQLCQEHYLLREQKQLSKIKVQILDDMWKHLMVAIEHSQPTLKEIDIKVLSVGDDNFDITPITRCPNLNSLKLLHFYEKESLSSLPRSLNKLVLNGPVTYEDMLSWTRNLQELTDLTLLLNVRGGKIDLKLFKDFIRMRNMERLTFIQCPMELDEIQAYYDSNLKTQKGIKFWFSGPREIRDIPSIQYVYTLINPEEFDRALVKVDQ